MSESICDELVVRPFEPADEEQVVDLWQRCGLVVPWNDPHQDIAIKLTVQPDLFLVGAWKGVVVATVMAGFEGHRGWLNYLAVSPDLRRRGVGRHMVEAAQAKLEALGCPKINLQVRKTNRGVIAFYERLGFSQDEVLSMGKRLRERG